MPLSPRDGFATTKPADIQSPRTEQSYFKVPTKDVNGKCVGTIVSYSFFNEMIAQQENLLNYMNIPVVGNDEFSLQKVAEKLLTGGMDYEVNSILVAGRDPFLKGAILNNTSDLDDYFVPGYYHNNADDNASLDRNFPEKKAGILHVYSDVLLMQDYRTFGGNNIYRRIKNTSGVWSAWSKFMSNTNGGSGSGFDCDLLDGNHGAHYTNADNLDTGKIPADRMTGQNYSFNSIVLSGNRIGFGAGTDDYLLFSDVDNYLRGYENNVAGRINIQFGVGDFSSVNAASNITVAGVSVQNAAILTSGTINDARLPASISSDITGNAATATQADNADKLDGLHASAFALSNELAWTPILRNANNSTIPMEIIEKVAYENGELCTVILSATVGQPPVNTFSPRLVLPVAAKFIQHVGACWALYKNFTTPYGIGPSISDQSNATDYGNFILEGNIAYFRNANHDIVSTELIDGGVLSLTITYLKA